MSRRSLAFTSIAVVTVLCIVGVSILAVAAGGSALAYQVNGNRVSQETLDGQLEDIANSKGVNESVKPTDGTVTSQVAAQVLTNNILRDLLRDAAERRGVKLTAADRDAGKQAAKSQLGANADKVPASYRDLIVETYAYANALG